ncbi:MAG: hydantoinase/oxoprolinase family protein, partial [Alphaproteobacteria bacterium]|nr:hydantoinase/oxoprolinase family protein [Alphaproteobacteria bacterium]
MQSRESYRVGVDIGGTFTDIVMIGSRGAAHIKKVPSTPDDYARGIVGGLAAMLEELDASAADIDGVVHATTVATNAVLEGKGARTGLITTRGFRDVLELRRARIPDLYNLDYEKPAPLVPRQLRREIVERMGPRGEVREALDEASVVAAAEFLKAQGVKAVAIALIHAYANPAHERRTAEVVRRIMPAEVFVTCSHEILPEIREYERTSTTCVNALLGPVMARYLASLDLQLRTMGVRRPLMVMQSNGGLVSARLASSKPARLLESGPAAGVVAAARIAKLSGVEDLIALDMGGTTVKTTIIEKGEPAKTTEYEVGAGVNLSSKLVQGAGYAVKLPFIDVAEIGAGGGSLVWFDKGGMPQVGPQSAGSVPGPVCYGTGGAQATLTDALVTLGYINPDYLVGGALRLDAAAARRAIQDQVASRLDGKPLDAAHGVLTIAIANMTRAVKAVSTYRGRDPRDFTLYAFGGNGPVVATAVAESLEMRRVLVPPSPGVFSACGLLLSDAEHELLRTLFRRVDAIDPRQVGDAFAALETEARALLREEGYAEDEMTIRRFADLRYQHQGFELTVPVARDVLPDLARIAEDFHAEHERTYGHMSKTDPVELVNVRVGARAAIKGATGL